MILSNIAIIGSSGTIGQALIKQLARSHPNAVIHAFSRTPLAFSQNSLLPDSLLPGKVIPHNIDYDDEQSMAAAAAIATKESALDCVIVVTGILHDGEMMPEKSLRDLSAEKFQHLFAVNTILPALIAKHFIPKLDRKKRSIFAALSARVGSISDNRLGGWYAYRASKAALNMVIKNAAIETARRSKDAIIVGLHPGTVDSALSKPYQYGVPEGKLFTPDYSAQKLLQVLDKLTPLDSGRCFAWDGKEVAP
ncbi:MAG: NAD(P)-dependent dehydrogenase (short-subunit alcohol dehydrogenase family) [Candidatus Endobugula sp.]|jgi:NAD(P)-dependent dehydrogenase (short-subunit alcohol dehydrogenase family)